MLLKQGYGHPIYNACFDYSPVPSQLSETSINRHIMSLYRYVFYVDMFYYIGYVLQSYGVDL